MKRKVYLISFLVPLLMVFFIGSIDTYSSEFKFSVEPIQSSKQIDKTLTYFDLMLKENEQETLQVKLGNNTEKDVVVDISLNQATTNSNGVTEYRKNQLKNTKNLPVDIKEIVEFPNQITVPAKSEKIVDFKVKMPSKSFDGVLAGGIQFREHGQEESHENNKDAVAINNTFSYILAVIIRENENTVNPNVEMKKAFMETKYGRSNNVLEFHNLSSAYINKMALDAVVFYEDNDEPISSLQKKDMQFAPNSIMDFKIGMGDKKVKPGRYNVKGTLYGDKSSLGSYEFNEDKYHYKLDFSETYTVDSKMAKEINKQNVILEDDNSSLIYIVIGLLILLIIATITIFYIINKNKKETLM